MRTRSRSNDDAGTRAGARGHEKSNHTYTCGSTVAPQMTLVLQPIETEPDTVVIAQTSPQAPRCRPSAGTRSRRPPQITRSPGLAVCGRRLILCCPSSSSNVSKSGDGDEIVGGAEMLGGDGSGVVHAVKTAADATTQ